MANNENRTGIVPVETVEKYEITTQQVNEYLQKRMNTFTTTARNNGEEIEDIHVNVVSFEFSKKFAPFAIVLPDDAIAERKNKGKDEGIMQIFQSEENNNLQKLSKPVWGAIASYLYTKNDKKSFVDSGNLKKTLGLTSGMANQIAGLCSPRIIKVDREHRHITCLLDPIRIFSDMVRKGSNEVNKDGAPKYMVMIDKVEKIGSGNYKYTISKEPKKRNHGGNSGIDILRIVRESVQHGKK